MIDNDEVMQTYSFTYTDCDGKVYKKEISTPGATWHECMDDYVKFLESVFGYAIKSQVRLEEPLWLGSMYAHHSDWIDPWTGEYFVKDKEVDPDDLGEW
jgi:hypothetical protein